MQRNLPASDPEGLGIESKPAAPRHLVVWLSKASFIRYLPGWNPLS